MTDIFSQATPEMVQQVADHSGYTPEQVNTIIESLNAIREGDPVGTVRRDPATRAVAHRVNAAGIHQWRVSAPDGTGYNDLQPTLPGWPELS